MNEETLNKKLKKLHNRMLFGLSFIGTPLMYAIDKIMGIDLSPFHYLFIFFLNPLMYYLVIVRTGILDAAFKRQIQEKEEK